MDKGIKSALGARVSKVVKMVEGVSVCMKERERGGGRKFVGVRKERKRREQMK